MIFFFFTRLARYLPLFLLVELQSLLPSVPATGKKGNSPLIQIQIRSANNTSLLFFLRTGHRQYENRKMYQMRDQILQTVFGEAIRNL